MFKQKNMHHSSIYCAWREIVGDNIARFSWPQRVSFDKNTNSYSTLHLEVSNSSFATELKYLETHLLEKIALFFGYNAISHIKIKIVLRPSSSAANAAEKKLNPTNLDYLQQHLAPIHDEELKKALTALGSLVLS